VVADEQKPKRPMGTLRQSNKKHGNEIMSEVILPVISEWPPRMCDKFYTRQVQTGSAGPGLDLSSSGNWGSRLDPGLLATLIWVGTNCLLAVSCLRDFDGEKRKVHSCRLKGVR